VTREVRMYRYKPLTFDGNESGEVAYALATA
jgi:hypothetical protein